MKKNIIKYWNKNNKNYNFNSTYNKKEKAKFMQDRLKEHYNYKTKIITSKNKKMVPKGMSKRNGNKKGKYAIYYIKKVKKKRLL